MKIQSLYKEPPVLEISPISSPKKKKKRGRTTHTHTHTHTPPPHTHTHTSQPSTEAFSSTAHKELSPAKNHINELGNVFFLEETFRNSDLIS